MRIVKATDAEKARWRHEQEIYPLFGYVTVAGKRCAVEALPERENRYEIHAPCGFHFASHGTHTLLAGTQKELLDEVGYETFDACGEDC